MFTRAGVTGRLQCRDKILNESEPLTGKRYLSFPGIAIRREYLEERGDVSVCGRLFLFLTDVCHGLISASAFVDVKSTAHPAGPPCSLSPPDWQNRFVEFEVSTFFVVVFFLFFPHSCPIVTLKSFIKLREFGLEEMQPYATSKEQIKSLTSE